MDPEAARDEELLERVAGGDHSAFTTLMRRHEDKVFGIALRVIGNRSDALDAAQDAFVSVYRRAGSFRGEAAFSTWLYRITTNACHDLLRRRKPESDLEAVPETATPGSGPEAAGTRVDIARALQALPSEYREAVVMHDLGGIPYEEIAAVTGAALGTVKSRISRGRRQLAQLLEQPDPGPPSKGMS